MKKYGIGKHQPALIVGVAVNVIAGTITALAANGHESHVGHHEGIAHSTSVVIGPVYGLKTNTC